MSCYYEIKIPNSNIYHFDIKVLIVIRNNFINNNLPAYPKSIE